LYANGNDLTTEGNSDKKFGEPTFLIYYEIHKVIIFFFTVNSNYGE